MLSRRKTQRAATFKQALMKQAAAGSGSFVVCSYCVLNQTQAGTTRYGYGSKYSDSYGYHYGSKYSAYGTKYSHYVEPEEDAESGNL